MKLTYRGISYTYTPNPIFKYGPVFAMGNYRGALLSFCTVENIPEQPRFDLTWRGIPYRSGTEVQMVQPTVGVAASETSSTGSAAKGEANVSSKEPETVTPKLSVLEQARNLFVRHHQKTRQREQSMLGRLNEEVGLSSEDAAHYESHVQGKIPHDFGGYDRSNAAMS